MFERFTDRARRVVVLAQDEARALNHDYFGTEHLLLGALAEGEGVAATALADLTVNLTDTRQAVIGIIGKGQQEPSGHLPYTPRARKVLELSLREALQFGHNYIGTEHLLLGIVREGEGIACQALLAAGASMEAVRKAVLHRLGLYEAQRQVEVRRATLEPCVCGHILGHHTDIMWRRCNWRDCGCPQYVASEAS